MDADPLERFGASVLDESTGARISRLRYRADLTVEEFAALVSRSPSWVRKVEADTFVVDRVSVLATLARALDVEPLALIHTALRDLTR